MLKIIWKPHRTSLKSGTGDAQKVFAMLKMIPDAEAAKSRPPLALALVIDTSASMQSYADQNEAKLAAARTGARGTTDRTDGSTYQSFNMDLPTLLDQAIQAAHVMVDDTRLAPTDLVSIIHFDDEARTLMPLTPISNRPALHAAIETLRNYAGGTRMAQGLRCALAEMNKLPPETAKRAIVFTDGAAFDEDKCIELLPQFTDGNTPIISIGFGEEYNDELMRQMADSTQGRPYHVRNMTDMGAVLQDEVGKSANEVVTDLKAFISTVKGVSVNSVTRVYPNLADSNAVERPIRLGNIEKGDYTVFIFEITVEGVERPPSRVRIAQLGLTANAPGLGRVQEFPPENLFIEFTTDEAAIASVDAEIIGYVQQKNVGRLVEDAVRNATIDASRAGQTLQIAAGMTQRLGNAAMTQMLNNAMEELNQSGTISIGTAKTVQLGLKTKTIKTGAVNDSDRGGLSSEDIRRLTGT
ncbi:VWA domain-containing protein [bacterium]|nr:MAG: VWA domain-containing protein [bacterium]